MLSNADKERIQAEVHASAIEDEIAHEPFAAGPMISELRYLTRALPDRAALHAGLGFCLKRIEQLGEARAALSRAESLLRGRGHVEIADRLRAFSEKLHPNL